MTRGGWYGNAPHRRQRWWCHPRHGERPHRFTELLPRVEAAGCSCVECSSDLDAWEGQSGARSYSFSARAIARALVLVARGSSYRIAAQAVHHSEGRPAPGNRHSGGWRSKGRRADEDGQLVANWVEVFGPVVCAQALSQAWPRVLLLDSTRRIVGGSGPCAGLGFSIFAAVGMNGPRATPWKLGAAPKQRAADWEAFLRGLPGSPETIITDDDAALTRAVRSVFPAAEQRFCEWHLAEGAKRALPKAISEDETHPVMRALAGGFNSVAEWGAFINATMAAGAPGQPHAPLLGAPRWLARNDARIRAQIASRKPGMPRSNGAVEAFLRSTQIAIEGREHRMTNLPRTLALFDLLTAGQQRGSISERAWAELVRDHLRANGGRAAPQRRSDDARGAWSLVA